MKRILIGVDGSKESRDAAAFAADLAQAMGSQIVVVSIAHIPFALAAPGWEAVVLVKPQFEAGRAEVKGGVVRSSDVRQRVVRELADAALAWQAQTAGVVDSGLPGPKGNREVFLHLVHRERPQLPDDIDGWISQAAL